MDEMDMEFAERVRALRRVYDITQDSLAEALDMPRTAISKIETCDRKVSVGEAYRIATALGVTIWTLLP